MKNIKKLLMVLLVAVMVIPFTVRAEDKKVNVYIFRGEGCPHCEEALEWFDGLEDKDKNKFNLIQYEVWKDQDNSNLMKRVARVFNDDAKSIGVPYIVVGERTFKGFSESYGQEILDAIDKLYNSEDVYDVMDHVESQKEENDSKAMIVIIAFVVVAAAGLIYSVIKSK